MQSTKMKIPLNDIINVNVSVDDDAVSEINDIVNVIGNGNDDLTAAVKLING